MRARVGSALWKQKQNLDLRKGVAEQLVVLDYSLPRAAASVATGCRTVASASTRDRSRSGSGCSGGFKDASARTFAPSSTRIPHSRWSWITLSRTSGVELRRHAPAADCSGFRDLAQIEMGSGESVPSGNERFHEFATVANGRQGRVRAWATHAAHPNEIWMPARALS